MTINEVLNKSYPNNIIQRKYIGFLGGVKTYGLFLDKPYSIFVLIDEEDKVIHEITSEPIIQSILGCLKEVK